ncbi:MAG TPA: ribonuclease H-like domain-containing protein [Methanocella sp.]|uniref:ribonuclease H-like domain-containing protein n=1 Tax=Methanocella sp. TaxID=2052833 RepID=UPI002C62A8D4|nr:ribonuclease H-like domain-containing protein [Methanocella sp.]HTY90821.1 ribonuclease H-like domain-containing protein [Methanocella sp.]
MPSWLYDDAYFEGQRVKKKYLKAYNGVRLEDAIRGTPVGGEFGECYLIESSTDFSISGIGREKARSALLSNLRLLRGIGPGTERKLHRAGYHDIESLLGHMRWRDEAKRFLSIVDSGDACAIQQELWHWLPKSHPLNLNIAAFTEVESLVALDIETMGLFSRPIILFGAAFTKGDKVITRQYLARSVDEEAAAIGEFCSIIEKNPLVSYNGRSFDVPYINQRRWYYGLGGDIDNVHFDMLPFARRFMKAKAPDARLTTIEKYLFGQERRDDVPGALVPEFYEEYLRTHNPGPLVPIVEHNRNDLVSLVRLFSKFCEGL